VTLSANEERLQAKVVAAANVIVIGAAAACLFVFLYYLYHYGWTGKRQFASWVGFLLYYICPAALAILLFASLRLRASRKVNLALLLCSATVSIYGLEILLTLWFSLPSVEKAEDRRIRAESARTLGVEFDARSPREILDDLLSRGADAIPSLHPQAFLNELDDRTVKSPLHVNGVELLPLAGIANKVVVLCNEAGRFVTYRSDDHGFNNPPKLWATVPTDVVAVGDSFVHGYCVDDNFVTVIRKRYPATLNLGMEGNGALIMLATIKEYAQIVRPKVVLWFYFEGNDLKDLRWERRSPLLMRYLTRGFSQNLAMRQAEIDRALADYLKAVKGKSDLAIKLEELSFLFKHRQPLSKNMSNVVKLSQVRERLGLLYATSNRSAIAAGPASQLDQSQMALFYDILVEAKRSVDEWGGNLYFVYLPTWERYGSASPSPRDDVLAAAARAGLRVVDIHPAFLSQKDPLALFPFRLPGHYNENGHRVVAEEVLRSIAKGAR
jgi:hypothetical protein